MATEPRMVGLQGGIALVAWQLLVTSIIKRGLSFVLKDLPGDKPVVFRIGKA
ncbi:hypothetical protein C8R32_101115 [Nitrosospira sp. Nsp5]|uniref:Uncharacterized protein n=1 Tax=Nitrosospira multiformis TaxID=1231 RepID=A0ABY0TGN0_9PROT|nr:hypothetical protein C8R32_101115 [Nitrosospira sp. Nsp5]SDQ80221.1 hypothetical protein SAMN05216402_2347 [Nitrosospira multiformis]